MAGADSRKGGAVMTEEQKIIETLFANAEKIRHGDVSLILKIHEGHITGVTHSVYEVTKERSNHDKTR
ncbi:hypothetical protein NO2_0702 [Candidatus Termititenax persephonae]|uniref:Uncharacterized protein n=1 Tax=Candidatus Termititenax persephonae TaxID=2218525 RepID=A0A388THC1_9BACT|nr:hypothetical protein NO2_0702 [Candidatus Termititenax persephonae]